jgi:uncharacterized protein (TIRG00374 family)
VLNLEKVTPNRLRYLGLLCFAFLIFYIGPSNLFQALIHTNPSYLLAAFVLSIPMIALKTLRWQVILSETGFLLPFSFAWRTYAAGIFIGCLTPGRLGEFVKAAYVSNKFHQRTGKIIPSVLIDRLFDLYFLLALGLIGLFYFSMAENQLKLWSLLIFVGLLLAVPLALGSPWIKSRLRNGPALGMFKPSWREALLEIQRQMSSLTATTLTIGIALTVLAYLVFFIQCQLGAWGTGVQIPFTSLVMVMSVTNFLSFLPVSVSGIGVRDASLIILLAHFGIDKAQAVAFSMAILFIFYLGGILLGGICWILEPIKFKTTGLNEVSDSSDEK